MSYTMTLDVPQKTVAYVKRQGPRFYAEMNALFAAIVSARMQYEDSEGADEVPGERLLASFREADEMEAGLRPRRDFKTAEELTFVLARNGDTCRRVWRVT